MTHKAAQTPRKRINSNFKAERPNQKWVGDTTELVTCEGRLCEATRYPNFMDEIRIRSYQPLQEAPGNATKLLGGSRPRRGL